MLSLGDNLRNRSAEAEAGRIACPRCLAPWLGSRIAGRQICPGCRAEFEGVWFNPPPASSIPASVTALESAAPCASHSGNAAEAVCSRCGRLMCALCRVDSDNRSLCAPCFERLAAEGALPSAVTRITDHLIRGRAYAMVSLVFWPLAVVLGPLALYLCVRAVVERLRSGETDGRVASLVFALVSLTSTGIGFFFMYAIATGS